MDDFTLCSHDVTEYGVSCKFCAQWTLAGEPALAHTHFHKLVVCRCDSRPRVSILLLPAVSVGKQSCGSGVSYSRVPGSVQSVCGIKKQVQRQQW